MQDYTSNMSVAPQNPYPESGRREVIFERDMAPSIPGNKGPLRFEEGIATDTDVPNDFSIGAFYDTAPSPMRQNHNNPEAFYKHAEDTMRERAHVGSASWIEAPALLSDFVTGAMSGDGMPTFEMEMNDGGYMKRPNATVVSD
jgi:hypothetical protein